LALLLAGCTTLKQCAYGGFNRDTWQQPEKVIQSLQLRPGAAVADLGSGGGYFTFRLAKAVGPAGKVYAVDIDQDINAALNERAKNEQAENIEVILAQPHDPQLPAAGVDLIFTSNTYHHIEDRVRYFNNLRKYLRPGGRVAIIDFDRRAWLEGLWRHYSAPEFIKREMEQAGYRLQQELDFLDRQSFLIFAPVAQLPSTGTPSTGGAAPTNAH
jgi:ubiquinone/menaquinone biosynthesis C-methylase UbiE